MQSQRIIKTTNRLVKTDETTLIKTTIEMVPARELWKRLSAKSVVKVGEMTDLGIETVVIEIMIRSLGGKEVALLVTVMKIEAGGAKIDPPPGEWPRRVVVLLLQEGRKGITTTVIKTTVIIVKRATVQVTETAKEIESHVNLAVLNVLNRNKHPQ